ncbi:MAG: hypothetical protein ACKV2T_38690 [Kofleriaceae bacterium]
MTFEILALITTGAATLLGLGFLFAGRFMLEQWGMDATDASLVMCRRYGAVYLGLALLFFLGRSAGPSELRSAVCAGLGVAIGLLACLGLFELTTGRVNKGIFVSVVVETLLSTSFFWVLWGQT